MFFFWPELVFISLFWSFFRFGDFLWLSGDPWLSCPVMMEAVAALTRGDSGEMGTWREVGLWCQRPFKRRPEQGDFILGVFIDNELQFFPVFLSFSQSWLGDGWLALGHSPCLGIAVWYWDPWLSGPLLTSTLCVPAVSYPGTSPESEAELLLLLFFIFQSSGLTLHLLGIFFKLLFSSFVLFLYFHFWWGLRKKKRYMFS